MMPLRLVSSFLPAHQPWITRHSYAHEVITALTYPAALALVEGGVIGVLATKAFHVNAFLFATIMAAPNFANLTSFLWARLARGRPKVRFIHHLQLAVLTAIGGITLLTPGGWGPVLLTLLIIITRCLMAGIVTLRSTVWRHNYPRAVRASVTGRLTLIQSLIMAGAPLAGYAFLDRWPQAYPIIYMAGIYLALIGSLAFARVRLRGERELLRYENTPAARPQPHGAPGTLGAPGAIYEYDKIAQEQSVWTILRRDRMYRQYMLWQFVAGGANMMGETVMIYAIARLTDGLRAQYLMSILLTMAVPMLVATLAMPYWAAWLDRVHVVRFRARQSWLWIADQVVNLIGVASGSLAVIALGRCIQGVARAAGMLAWNLGHNDFADRRFVALYMGIHVTLTGVRGAMVPFLGMGLFAGWNAFNVPLLNMHVPGWAGIGAGVFIVTAALTVVSNLGFTNLARQMNPTPSSAA